MQSGVNAGRSLFGKLGGGFGGKPTLSSPNSRESFMRDVPDAEAAQIYGAGPSRKGSSSSSRESTPSKGTNEADVTKPASAKKESGGEAVGNNNTKAPKDTDPGTSTSTASKDTDPAEPTTADKTPPTDKSLADSRRRAQTGKTSQQSVTAPTKADLDKYRAELKVPERNTVAVGRTDVKGLEDVTFKGASPEVRKQAGLSDLDTLDPRREITSPAKDPRGRNHAEEGVVNDFNNSVKAAKLKPEEVKGTLYIHQSNPRGFCTTCIQGITNPKKAAGVLLQLSQKYPNLVIRGSSETIEGVKAAGRHSFTLQNGKYIEVEE
jgi:hypothetical protein